MKSKPIQIISNIIASTIILALAISYFYLPHDDIQRPYILLIGACFTALNIKSSRIQLFQSLMAFYLFMILSEPLSSKYFLMPIGVSEISVPLGFVLLLVLVIFYAVSKITCQTKITAIHCENLPLIITVSIASIAAQMLILFFMLQKFYSYGYEYNFSVMGKLIFVAMMFLFTYETFEKIRFRQLSAVVFAIIFTILTFKGLSL